MARIDRFPGLDKEPETVSAPAGTAQEEMPRAYSRTRLGDYTEDTREKRGPMDLPFLLLTLLLLCVGLVMVLSASFARAYYDIERQTGGRATYYFIRQLIFSVSGVALMLAAARFKISTYRRMSVPLLLISVVLLLAVPVIGVRVNGAKRWISLGFTTFQPSEICKIAVILSFAQLICVFKEKMQTFKYGILPFIAIIVVICGLLLLEPHVSACVIVVMLGAVMLFAGGVKLRWFGIALGGAAGAGVLVATKFAHASARIQTWLDPFKDPRGDGWQIIQSLYSIGSGGLLGVGLGQSRQKYLYLPEEHNDFIFAVVCEELGLIGALLILALFAMLIIRGYWIAMHARNRYSSLIATGVTTLLALQVILNVAVVTNLVPCTGISLPFFSYGGTALWLQLIEMGIILSVSRDVKDVI